MGYVGGKIPGHTGTQFKHKKVFSKIKKKLKFDGKSSKPILVKRETYEDDPIAKAFRVIVGLISSVVLLSLLLIVLWSIGNIKLHRNQLSTSFLNEIEKKENKEAAIMLYNSAESYYNSGYYDAAQNEIQRILNIYPTNSQAIELMSDILKKQCELKNIFCDSAKDYEAYLKQTEKLG